MTTWRNDTRLAGRFHPAYPDDLQVLAHDGGPRTSTRSPELLWARIVDSRPSAFVGHVLNQPHQLQSVRAGDPILFVMPEGWKYPLLVTEQYLQERAEWNVHPCARCGLSELFDPPSALIKAVFPNLPPGASMQSFTALCGGCGGAQVVYPRGTT